MAPSSYISSQGSPTNAKSNLISVYDNEAGTTLEHQKRKARGLIGLLPLHVETLDVQRRRALKQVRSKSTMLEKYIFLAQLRSSNPLLFYKIIIDDLQEFAPIIYTPTVGTACIEYSNIYPFLAEPGVPDGLYLDSTDLKSLEEAIRNYCPVPNFSPEITVITDGSRILGLGDLGSNGIGISIGKLQLYVAGAGIDPRRTLPIALDLGTNNEKLLNDEFYLGLIKSRPDNNEFYSIVDTVLQTLHQVYPNILIQFEDWSSEHAFGLLEKYQNKLLCFNDDIQGTGAVILSGVINAIRKVQKETGVEPQDHRIVFYGAGSSSIGVARQIQHYFQKEFGISEKQAKDMFWIVDSKGLITQDRGDRLSQHKVHFARVDNDGRQFKALLDIIDYVKPTALIGLSAVAGAFDHHVLQRLASINEQPIIFPLSNPSTQAECSFIEAMESTNNRVIFASGTAFPSFTVPETGETHIPGQGNNMYIFPGLGLGAVLSQSRSVSDEMIYNASKALADSLTPEETSCGWLYPSLSRIREVSTIVAAAVIEQAIEEDLCQSQDVQNLSHEELLKYVSSNMWSPSEETYGIMNEKSSI